MNSVMHPAVYPAAFFPVFMWYLAGREHVLDPFAGTGRIARLKEYGFTGRIIANEIEAEWAAACVLAGCDIVLHEDAEQLPALFPQGYDAVCTSPTYGNRMADHFVPKDSSTRYTYRSALGHDLAEGNTGRMQFGERYCAKHIACYAHLCALLRPGAVFILNTKDFIRNGKRVEVTKFHTEALSRHLTPVTARQIASPGIRHGQNGDRRIAYETITIFQKEGNT
jgi:hypothetical protein